MDKPTPNTRSVSALERIRNAAENKYVRVGSAISIGLGSLSLAGCADPTPNVDPTSTSQPSPETPAPSETLNLDQFNFDVSKNPEQLGENFASLETFQRVGNITDQLKSLSLSESEITKPIEEFAREQATKHITTIFEQHYVPTWKEDQDLASYFNFLVNQNAALIVAYVTSPDSLDLKFSSTSSSMTPTDSGARLDLVVSLSYEGLPADPNNDTLDGQLANTTIELVQSGDRYLISGWESRVVQ